MKGAAIAPTAPPSPMIQPICDPVNPRPPVSGEETKYLARNGSQMPRTAYWRNIITEMTVIVVWLDLSFIFGVISVCESKNSILHAVSKLIYAIYRCGFC